MNSVLLIDHQDIVRFALETLMSTCPHLKVVGSAATVSEGLALIRQLQPDLVITELALPDASGLPAVRAVVHAQEPRRTLVFSMQDELLYGPPVLSAGAGGFVSKQGPHACVVDAALKVLEGGVWVSPRLSSTLLQRSLRRSGRARRARGPADGMTSLTTREVEVLEHLRAGKSTKQIASALDLSVRTIDLYRAQLKSKLGFRTSAELIVFAAQSS